MSYLALYRRYRPDNFATVYGQRSQILALQNAVAKGMVHHSYVFAGPRGTGKTSVARIFAKAVNCENPNNGDCCNKCNPCKLINAGTAIDVTEIDAASNNGVDEVRKLLEGVSYVPVALRKKVYIVDEAHMLTASAWNALLKTLEEPPEYVIFIIATTEPNKIPLTILSRSQRYDFLRISETDLKDLLTKIAKEEKMNVEDVALTRIAQLSQGGARDAIGILDQLSLTTSGKVTEASLIATFNLVESKRAVSLAKALLQNDSATALSLLDALYESGKSLPGICNDLLSVLVEVSLFDGKAPSHLAFIDDTSGPELMPYKDQAKQMAHRLVTFMTSLRSFEINRHHYRLLFVEMTGSRELPQPSLVVEPSKAVVKKTNVRHDVETPTNKGGQPTPVLTRPDPTGSDGLPRHLESAVEIFSIDLPDAAKTVASERKKPAKVADKATAPLLHDVQAGKLSTDDLILAVMYLNDKALRDTLQAKLEQLETYFVEQPREAAMYRDSKVLVACPRGVVIIFDQESKATLFNADIKKFNHELFATTLFGGSYKVAATDRAKARELGEKVKIMSKNGTVPSGVAVLEDKVPSGKDSSFDFASDIFGKEIKVV